MEEEDDLNLKLYGALNGSLRQDEKLIVGSIPILVASKLGWSASEVFLTHRDAQKIAHHPSHGMDFSKSMALPFVISKGDYYRRTDRGTDLQLEIILHEPENPKRVFYLVLARDALDQGIFIRTFFFDGHVSRSKMKKAELILMQGNANYFIREN